MVSLSKFTYCLHHLLLRRVFKSIFKTIIFIVDHFGYQYFCIFVIAVQYFKLVLRIGMLQSSQLPLCAYSITPCAPGSSISNYFFYFKNCNARLWLLCWNLSFWFSYLGFDMFSGVSLSHYILPHVAGDVNVMQFY